ncbi:DUF1616 domain-containing protein [Natranaeroarchaeum sulfidigenes]|uniref:Membrane associated protein with extracellular Ig-like domain, a component of a putative secretion system n=1 Tax=Natranaeroarchaeum sulfidigenes TaxID=2784880 RepID=A0A897MXE2_9EURY|nr:DUF1616 domain-containing protein [Natranaeroarchaeum sulfidigenes]QSG03005.1 Membrane associated protein with extracellular Ig-like domain, a component of a putative secretion system [Natranaeroarchaeum sulfidigenes]
MSENRSAIQQARELVTAGSADATFVIGYVAVIGALLYVADISGVIRTILGLPILLVLPGYALVSLVFPGMADETQAGPEDETSSVGLVGTGVPGWYERLALAVAISVVLLPLFGLVLATTPLGFSTGPVLISLAGFIVIVMIGAVVRRVQLPEEERFVYPGASADTGLFPEDSPVDGVLNVVLLISVVVAMGTVAYGLAAPQPEVGSTGVQLLTETDDGELVAGEYPEAIPPGESAEMIVGVTSDGTESSTYTVVIEAQHVEEDGDELAVLEEAELGRVQLTPEPGERATQETTISPPMAGENIRLNYYLYEGDAPEDADSETADDHLWITVDGA